MVVEYPEREMREEVVPKTSTCAQYFCGREYFHCYARHRAIFTNCGFLNNKLWGEDSMTKKVETKGYKGMGVRQNIREGKVGGVELVVREENIKEGKVEEVELDCDRRKVRYRKQEL